MLGFPAMRLVTYDRRGHRRLGAILDGRVVDLPDTVGHPAFPTTLEAFVQSSRGTVLDAARAALARDDVKDHVVKRAHVLPPLFPRSLLLPGGPESMVEVKSKAPVKYTFEPVVLTGKLSILKDDPTGVFYRLTDAVQTK